MIVSMKDGSRLFGISIMTCCAVTVCNLFLNYYLDLTAVAGLIGDSYAKMFYDAQVMTAKVVCGVAGGCLAATTVVMLVFYIKHYIDSHSGYLLAFALMPRFYELQNADAILPAFPIRIHWRLFFLLVIAPTAAFGLLAVCFSMSRLNQPCVNLLRGITRLRGKTRDGKEKPTFVAQMRSAVLKSRKTLVFLIGFSAFCFSDMIQMAFSMDEMASEMMGLMLFIIGVVLGFTTLYIAVTTVIRSNQKNIAMMRVFGYDSGDCKRAVLDGYRPAAYIGFLIGSVYQYLLLKIMVNLVFAGIEGVPEYRFDFPVFFLTLAVFILVYEGIMFACGRAMKQIPLKQIMSE